MTFEVVQILAWVALVALAIAVFAALAKLSAQLDRMRADFDHEKVLRRSEEAHAKFNREMETLYRKRVGSTLPDDDGGLHFEPVTYREAIARYPLPDGVTDPVAKSEAARLSSKFPEPGRGKTRPMPEPRTRIG